MAEFGLEGVFIYKAEYPATRPPPWSLVLASGSLILAVSLLTAYPAAAAGKHKIFKEHKIIKIFKIFKKHKITWTPSSVTTTIAPGESKTLRVSFTASRKLRNIVVRVPGELQPFVQVDPSAFERIDKGQTVSLNLLVLQVRSEWPKGRSDSGESLDLDSGRK
jgi:hypothetical protein